MGIAIVGAGGHGRVALECLELSQGVSDEVVFFDDRSDELDAIEGVSVLGPIAALTEDSRFGSVFVAIGSNVERRRVFQALERAGKTFLTIIHPHTAISPRVTVGAGTIAVAGTVVNRDACVGRGVIMNTLCSVGHDVIVEDFAQVSPGVNLGGAAVIEEGAFLGIGAKVVPEVRVGAWSVVGAGSVVLKDLPPRSFCIGTPARVVRELRDDEFPSNGG
ncbi:MAG: acetyltransferase [Candidatus Bipolaricaulia bacterium]